MHASIYIYINLQMLTICIYVYIPREVFLIRRVSGLDMS